MNNIALFALLLFPFTTQAQDVYTDNKTFISFDDYVKKTPTDKYEFNLKKKTDKDIFMLGGIHNYKIKSADGNKESSKTLDREVWGVAANNKIFINSTIYSGVRGYNEILGIGYYTYFIGEPARTEKKQRETGIIKPTERVVPVCCNVGYVLLKNGTVKFLNTDYLEELLSDNELLLKKLKDAKLTNDDVYDMFGLLKEYNSTKH